MSTDMNGLGLNRPFEQQCRIADCYEGELQYIEVSFDMDVLYCRGTYSPEKGTREEVKRQVLRELHKAFQAIAKSEVPTL